MGMQQQQQQHQQQQSQQQGPGSMASVGAAGPAGAAYLPYYYMNSPVLLAPGMADMHAYSAAAAAAQAAADGRSRRVGVDMRPGDWMCPIAGCGSHNFARRPVCRQCGAARPGEAELSAEVPAM
jgi:hypothetical protein